MKIRRLPFGIETDALYALSRRLDLVRSEPKMVPAVADASLRPSCATKHALSGFNGALLRELVDTPIRVTEIQPGVSTSRLSVRA